MPDAFALVRGFDTNSCWDGCIARSPDFPVANVHHEEFWPSQAYAERVNGFMHLRAANARATFHYWYVLTNTHLPKEYSAKIRKPRTVAP